MKYAFLLISLLVASSALQAQSVAVYFEIIPEQHLLQIDANRRKDMLDMKRVGQRAVVPNRLGGTAELTDLTDRYLRVQTSAKGSFEMCLFPTENDDEQVLGVIKTVCGPACDSELTFYTTTWEPLNGTPYYTKPTLNAFLRDSVDTPTATVQQALQSVDMPMIRMQFDPATYEVVSTLNLKDVLPDYIYKEVSPLFLEEIREAVKR